MSVHRGRVQGAASRERRQHTGRNVELRGRHGDTADVPKFRRLCAPFR